MKNSIIGLVFLASIACAQDAEKTTPAAPPKGNTEKTAPTAPPKGNTEMSKPAGRLRRLESVTWNPMQLQLSWVVSVWDLSNTEVPCDLEHYIVHIDTKQIELNGKAHSFEAADDNLGAVLDLISAFSMKSTAWWGNAERGTGGADRNAAPDGPDDKKDKPKDPVKKDQPSPKLPVPSKIAQDEQTTPATPQSGIAHQPLY